MHAHTRGQVLTLAGQDSGSGLDSCAELFTGQDSGSGLDSCAELFTRCLLQYLKGEHRQDARPDPESTPNLELTPNLEMQDLTPNLDPESLTPNLANLVTPNLGPESVNLYDPESVSATLQIQKLLLLRLDRNRNLLWAVILLLVYVAYRIS
jgi:hypothetical protein